MRVAFAGTPEFALPALEALAVSPHEIVGVLTQPDRPRGRGRRVEPGPVKRAALERGLPVAQPSTLKDDAARAGLAAWRPDLLIVVAYGMILPRAVLDVPRFGCVNIHASLLPRWRGAAPIERAILAGDSETGVTIMLMDAGLDTGPVLLQRRLPIDAAATAGRLRDALAALGAQALLETLGRWPHGDLTPQPQPATGVTMAPKIAKSEARLDWTLGAEALERKVRAFNPRPVAETDLDGDQLRIHAARALAEDGAHRAPGTVLGSDADGIRVACGRGRLLITELQLPGRRPVAAREFARSVALEGRVLGAASAR